MKTQGINKKRVTAFILSFLLVMQQSLAYQALASSITDANNNPIKSDNGSIDNGIWNMYPDAVNGQTGFKQFGEIKLDQGDILNFMYQYLMQNVEGDAGNLHLEDHWGNINNFVALVNKGVNINGIVNALRNINEVKTDGNLMIISPNGMVVGASGVLNVGSLSVIAPTQDSYTKLSDSLGLPKDHKYRMDNVVINQGTGEITTYNDDYTTNTAIPINKTLDTSVLSLKSDTQTGGNIDIQAGGRIAARGDVSLQGGQVNVNGLVVAGLGNNKTGALTGDTAANELFGALVNVDNMGSGNTFVNNNGNIEIKSVTGTSIGGKVKNYGKGNITITNEGASGVNITGEVSNPNGNLTVTNSAGELLVDTIGIVKNKGTMTFTNNGEGTGIKLNGKEISNTGTLLVTNEIGANGLLVGGNITNNGDATFTNSIGELLVDTTGVITNNGNLTFTNNSEAVSGIGLNGIITNEGTLLVNNNYNRDNAGISVGGTVKNTGDATFTDHSTGNLNVTGSITNTGNLTMTSGDLLVSGAITNNEGKTQISSDLFNVQRGGTITSNGTSMEVRSSDALISGTINNNSGDASIINGYSSADGQLLVDTTGIINSKGTSLQLVNYGNDGMTIAGQINHNNSDATVVSLYNSNGELLVDTTGRITSDARALSVDNSGADGMDIQGKVTNTNANANVFFNNNNSDMKLGSSAVDKNIESNADVTIQVTNGDLLNNGVNNVLIATTDGAGLNIDVQNGSIGSEVGPNDGVYTGIGQNHRDLTKSVNIAVDGDVKAVSKGNGSLINLASIDKDMKVDQIKANGRVILLADSSTKGKNPFNIVNGGEADKKHPSVEGTGISIIASGNIGEAGNALTFRQNGAANIFYGDDATQPHVPTNVDEGEYGVDMLAIKDINIKGMDAEDGTKLDTNVGGLISREGSINAEFSGDVYVRETTAANRIDMTTRGKNMYIKHLGEVPTYENDYYGENTNIHPEKAKLTAFSISGAVIWYS